MATKFLDYTGLSYLWSKIKGWCNSIFVTKATDENITGTKTFVGSKKIAFKQSGANDKLGFTLFNNSGKEQGYLEYNPTNKIAGIPLMMLGNYATAADELTYVGFRRYSNISGASGAYNLLTPLISDAKSYFNLTTTYTNFYLPLGISDGTNVVTADNGGVVNISSLLPSVSTIGWSNVTSKPTTISGYGITDAKIDNGTITLGSNSITPLTSHQTLPTLSRTISGSGNAITDITVSGHAITATKGTTFLTSHQSLADYAKLASPVFTGTPTAPTAAASTNNTQIATTAFVKSQGYLTSHQTLPTLSLTTSGNGNAITALSVSNHAITATKGTTFLTSHQDISGKVNKSGDTMTGNLTAPTVIVSGSFVKQHPSITKGTNPSATQYWTLTFSDKNGSNYSDNCLGMLETSISATGVVSTYIRAMKNTAANSSNCQISCIYDTANNTAYTAAPTPATADNSTKIATTAFVKAQGYITSSGSITGNAATVSGTAGTSLLAWNTENTVYTVGGHAIKVKLPANPNTDTHWTSHLYAGASNGNANAATTNGNTYLIICDNSTARDRRLIKGTGATTVTSDANGNIIINSTDNNTVYTHPTTSGNKHIPSGGSSGQILRWSADGTATWGNDNNTTYSVATQSANGLMSAADKKKLDGIEAGADNIPVGGIIYYAKKATPGNYLICNGAAVSRTTYATLYNVIGTTYGKGDNSTTFNVPNLIDRFPQGNATPGTVKAAGLPNITGQIKRARQYLWESQDGCFKLITETVNMNSVAIGNPNNYAYTTEFKASYSNSIYGGSSTVQPPALTLVPCIRYA